jgi:hypothetical protein
MLLYRIVQEMALNRKVDINQEYTSDGARYVTAKSADVGGVCALLVGNSLTFLNRVI